MNDINLSILGWANGLPVIDRPMSHNHNIGKYELRACFNTFKPGDKNSPVYVHSYKFNSSRGESCVVTTTDSSRVFYAIRKNRKGFSRICSNAKREISNYVTIVLLKQYDHYVLLSAWFGTQAHREPFDPMAEKNDILWWQQHAFVDDATEYYEDTVIVECPWPDVKNGEEQK